MVSVIPRHRQIQSEIDMDHLPTKVSAKEFKDLDWLDSESALRERLTRIRALQIESFCKVE